MKRPGGIAARSAWVLVGLAGALVALPVASSLGSSAGASGLGHAASRPLSRPGFDAMRARIRPHGPDLRLTAGSPLRPGSGSASARGPASRADARNAGILTSSNWSGLIDTLANVSDVSGEWTIPAVRPSQALEFTSTWIGIGGITGTTTAPLIQAGVTEATITGKATYAAWYEMLPAAPKYLTTSSVTTATNGALTGSATFSVHPGDTIQTTIQETSATQWKVTLADTTRSWTYTHTFTYSARRISAEWITERPALLTGTSVILSTLADYGSSSFTHLQLATTGGAPHAAPTTAGTASYRYTNMYDTVGDLISIPGAVSAASTSSFTDKFVVTRTAGSTADYTAADELVHQFPYGNSTCPGPGPTAGTRPVVLATDANYPDALASAYLASYLKTGTLLTPTKTLSPAASLAIRDEGITHVFIVGGFLAVSTTVANTLKRTLAFNCGGKSQTATDIKVTRIAGATMYGTAQQIALWPTQQHSAVAGHADLANAYTPVNATTGDGLYNTTAGKASTTPPATPAPPTAILATGLGFQDAESASTMAYAEHFPILLTTPKSLSTLAATALKTLGIKQVIVIGGQLAIHNTLVTALEALTTHPSVLRIAGKTYTQTSVELAKCELGAATTGLAWSHTGSFTVARGDFYPDGLAGAVLAADGPSVATPEPLLLTFNPSTIGPYLTGFLQATAAADGVTQLTVLGGRLAVTPTTVNTLLADIGYSGY